MSSEREFRVGQVWSRAGGPCYRVVAKEAGAWGVVIDRSPGVYRFSTARLRRAIKTRGLCLSRAGQVVDHLCRVGLAGLAREVVALLPDEIPDALQDRRALEDKLEHVSPEYRGVVRDSLDKVEHLLTEEGPVTEPEGRAARPNYVSRDSVDEPDRITR